MSEIVETAAREFDRSLGTILAHRRPLGEAQRAVVDCFRRIGDAIENEVDRDRYRQLCLDQFLQVGPQSLQTLRRHTHAINELWGSDPWNTLPKNEKARAVLSDVYEVFGSPLPNYGDSQSAQLGRQALYRVNLAIKEALIQGVIDRAGTAVGSASVRKAVLNMRSLAGEAPDRVEALTTAILGDVAEDVRTTVTRHVGEALSSVQTVVDDLQVVQTTFAHKVAQHQNTAREALSSLNGAIINVNDGIRDRVSQLREARQNALRGGDLGRFTSLLQENISDCLDNNRRVRFVKQVLFGQFKDLPCLSAADTMIDASVRGALKGARDGIMGEVDSYCTKLSGMTSLLSDAGLVSREVAGSISKVVGLGQAATGIASSIATGNYIGAAMGIAGLLGGGGPFGGGRDVGAERHEEIMRTQRQILDGIDQILEGQRLLAQGIEHLLQGQQKIIGLLLNIHEAIHDNHIQTMERLGDIEGRLFNIQIVISEQYSKDLQVCLTLEDFIQRRPMSYTSALKVFSTQKRRECKMCAKGITYVVAAIDDSPELVIPSFFFLDMNPAGVEPSEDGYTQYLGTLSNAMKLFANIYNTSRKRATAIKRFATPTFSFNALMEKSSASEGTFDQVGQLALGAKFEKILNCNAVLQATDAVLFAHMYNVENSVDDFVLEKLRYLIDLALAQQSMLGGDALLPEIGRLIENSTDTNSLAIQILESHPIIARNFAFYSVRMRDRSKIAYGPAARTKVASSMQPLVPSNCEPVWQEKLVVRRETDNNGKVRLVESPAGWSLRVTPTLQIPLPDIEQYEIDVPEFTKEFLLLMQARKKVSEAIMGYKFAEQDRSGKYVIEEELWKHAVTSVFF